MMHILYNAKVYTLAAPQARATALAIDNGYILGVGNDEEILSTFSRPGSLLQNMQERIILPGLTDAHIHLEHYALSLQKVDCEVASKDECLQRVAKRAGELAPGTWVLGHGWNQNDWEPPQFPTAAELDRIAPQHPVYLTAKSLHAGWANSAALQAAHIHPGTPDPEGGKIQRDEHGNPTGILFERAMQLASGAIPEVAAEEVALAIEEAQKRLWRFGITAAHDFDRQRCFSALQILHQRAALKLRVTKSIPLESLSHAVELGLRTGFGDDWLRIGSIKAFADGALGPRTAAMLQAYEEEPENRGMLLLDAEELFEHARLASKNGLSIAVHAIGDLANHEVLNAYEQLRAYERKNDLPRLRHRIEHVQLIHPADASRLAELEIIASMQPIHALSDMRMADRYWGKRARLSYAWRTQLEHGATLAFGSDAPVDSPNPFWGLYAALTRQLPEGHPGAAGWYPEQRLTVYEALKAYTSGAAYTAWLEDRLGLLARGYFADLIVLNSDPFECNPMSLRQLGPVATMVGGEWVFSELD